MIALEYLLLGAATLLLLSILFSRASSRLGVPVLLIFLAIGMLAGSDGPGGIYFDNARIAQALGVVSLVFILFAGGLETKWQAVRPVLWQGLSLATLGVFLTAFLVGWFARIALGFSWVEGLLLGAIVSSTDAAAVFAVLRSRSVRLRSTLEPLLELESGSNDPMAVFLTIGLIQLLSVPGASVTKLVLMFFLQMGLGAGMGLALGRAGPWIINRSRLEYEGLYPVLTIALVLLTYGATSMLGGNGFLAAYLAGILLGNSDFIHKRSLIRFHDGLAWLMQIAMFLTLGLLVFPKRLVPVIAPGLMVAGFLILVARPLSVLISLALARLSLREKAMVAWTGLRGAAPIILATFPLLAGIAGAETYFNLVFFIVLTSSLLQGTTIPLLARWLRVEAPKPVRRESPPEFDLAEQTRNELVEIQVPADSAAAGHRVMDLALPQGTLIVLLFRDSESIVPGGGTVIEAGDRLIVFAARDALAATEAALKTPRP
ncbi:MAG TPA: potassium/proton antiporter [Blastocatellia bacterium]|nr:potassium/proton antiporter [Blastocatellia bacterium]